MHAGTTRAWLGGAGRGVSLFVLLSKFPFVDLLFSCLLRRLIYNQFNRSTCQDGCAAGVARRPIGAGEGRSRQPGRRHGGTDPKAQRRLRTSAEQAAGALKNMKLI